MSWVETKRQEYNKPFSSKIYYDKDSSPEIILEYNCVGKLLRKTIKGIVYENNEYDPNNRLIESKYFSGFIERFIYYMVPDGYFKFTKTNNGKYQTIEKFDKNHRQQELYLMDEDYICKEENLFYSIDWCLKNKIFGEI